MRHCKYLQRTVRSMCARAQDEGELADAVALYEEGFKYTQSPWERDTLEKGLRNFVLRLSMKGQTPNIDALLKRCVARAAAALPCDTHMARFTAPPPAMP